MRFYFREQADKGGVYKITNTTNGRIYIGSTSCFRKRAKGHKGDLEMNRHCNGFFQNDFNKCGTDAFMFEILEVVDKSENERLLREQFYLDQFYDNKKNCYNISKEAKRHYCGKIGKGSRHGKPLDEEHKAKISQTNKEVWQDSELRKQASLDAHKRWDKHHANITVTNRDSGEVVTITGSIRPWCLERGINYKTFHQMINGKVKVSQGWFLGTSLPKYVERKGEVRKPLSPEHRSKIAGSKFVGMKLRNDRGEEITIESNVKEQARKLGMDYTTLLKVLKGSCNSIKQFYLTL